MTQQYELSVLGPELVDGRLDRTCKLGILEVAEWVLGLVFHNEFDLIAIAVGPVQRHRFEFPAAQVIDPEIVADTKQPGRKPILRVESLQRVPRTDEGLLTQLLGEFDIADKLTQERRQTSLIATHQEGERIFVPIQGESHQFFVGGLFKAHSAVMIQGSARPGHRQPSPKDAVSVSGVRVRLFAEVKMRMTWLTLVAVLCFGVVSVSAQIDEPAEAVTHDAVGGVPYEGEVDVTVVNVNVYVTNKQGLAVTDLTPEDFILTQDGSVKPISNFDLFTEEIYRSFYLPDSAPSTRPTPTPIPGTEDLTKESFRPIYVVLYFDNENSRALDRNRLITQMRSFVRENLHPPMQMMVISYQKSYDVLQSFTDDQRAINDALREIRMMTGSRTELDSHRKDILRGFSESNRNSQPDIQAMNRGHGQMVGFAEEEANSLQFTLGALRDTVTMLSGLPGKKIIVYISNGLPMIAGLDLFYAYSNAFHETSAITESARYNMNRHYTSLISNANAQDISFYTFGVGGLENPTLAGSELGNPQDSFSASLGMQNYLDPLRYMSENTGGTAVVNTNDFTLGLEKVAQDFFTYYSLGYSLQQSGLDKVHRIKVEIPNHPEYRVRYRRRFVEKSLESRVQDKVVTGLMFPLEFNPMQIMVEIGDQGPASETRWMVPFKLSFPLRRVTLLPQGEDYVGNVTMFLAARNTKGDRSDVVRQVHEIRVKAADYDDAQLRRYTITANLLMEEGSHNVAVGLLDPITQTSSYATTRVTIKD